MIDGAKRPAYLCSVKYSITRVMQKHFERVAPRYRNLRDTDLPPVYDIQKTLGKRSQRAGADVGCGVGRYTRLIAELLKPKLLAALDASRSMLSECRRHLSTSENPAKTLFLLAEAHRLPLAAGVLGFMTAFNCIHHFRLPFFLVEAARVLELGGLLVVYTRLKDQNRRTIWGEYFPRFAEKETRLPTLANIKKALARTGRFTLREIRHYQFERRSGWKNLEAQVKNRHYSTFSLYTPSELRRATERFKRNLAADFDDLNEIPHRSENTLLVLEKTA